MLPRIFVASVIFVLAFVLMLPAWASTEVVGHISQVEGEVDLLKGGRLPATPVKLQDKVESGDLIRTKRTSKAQITFIDNSTVIIFPESRVTIEEYRFDAAKGNLRAVLQLSQGQVHAFIHKASQGQQPDFVIKTHTAVVRFRGTEFGCRSHLNLSTIMNFAGSASVINNSPGAGEEIHLSDMQTTTVAWARHPTPALQITAEDRRQFMNPPATTPANVVALGPNTPKKGSAPIAATPDLSLENLAAGQVPGGSKTAITTVMSTAQHVPGANAVPAAYVPPILGPQPGTGGAVTFPSGRGPQPGLTAGGAVPGSPNTGGTVTFPTGHGPQPGR